MNKEKNYFIYKSAFNVRILWLILMILASGSVFSQNFDLSPWLEFCRETKNFAIKSKAFGFEEFNEISDRLDLDHELLVVSDLIVPLYKGEKITKFRSPHRSLDFVIDFEYKNGLNILISQRDQEIEDDIYERFFDTLEKEYFDDLIDFVGILPNPLRGWVDDGFAIDYFRLLGPFEKVNELKCKVDYIAEDIQTTVLLFSQVIAPYSTYDSDSNRIWFQSENTYPGIISKTLRPPTGDRESEFVYWSGEFIKDEKIFQVLIYYPVDMDNRFGYLGSLLAAPATVK